MSKNITTKIKKSITAFCKGRCVIHLNFIFVHFCCAYQGHATILYNDFKTSKQCVQCLIIERLETFNIFGCVNWTWGLLIYIMSRVFCLGSF